MKNERTTHYHKDTPEQLKNVLESLIHANRRVRLFLGHQDTGEDWNEENDVTGYIGRTTGEKPITILLNNRRSIGGGAILTHCIVKLVDIQSGRVLYQHPKYHTAHFFALPGSDMPEYAAEVYSQKAGVPLPPRELYARCKSMESALRLADFMEGKRNNK